MWIDTRFQGKNVCVVFLTHINRQEFVYERKTRRNAKLLYIFKHKLMDFLIRFARRSYGKCSIFMVNVPSIVDTSAVPAASVERKPIVCFYIHFTLYMGLVGIHLFFRRVHHFSIASHNSRQSALRPEYTSRLTVLWFIHIACLPFRWCCALECYDWAPFVLQINCILLLRNATQNRVSRVKRFAHTWGGGGATETRRAIANAGWAGLKPTTGNQQGSIVHLEEHNKTHVMYDHRVFQEDASSLRARQGELDDDVLFWGDAQRQPAIEMHYLFSAKWSLNLHQTTRVKHLWSVFLFNWYD